MPQEVRIKKADGSEARFEPDLLVSSLMRAGASEDAARRVRDEMVRRVRPGMTTHDIWRQAREILRRIEHESAIRYGLKQAIMELGPTGFPFERYIAEVLRAYGYETKTGEIVQGACVRHEVDVIAKKDQKHFLIEAKYHNMAGTRSDVKVALYVWARFLDIQKAWEREPSHANEFHRAWLVTNTKCTTDAIRYGECVGLRILSWSYPHDANLARLIEEKGLYPVTILPSLKGYVKTKLAEAGFMMARDLCSLDVSQFSKQYRVSRGDLEVLRKDASIVCGQ